MNKEIIVESDHIVLCNNANAMLYASVEKCSSDKYSWHNLNIEISPRIDMDLSIKLQLLSIDPHDLLHISRLFQDLYEDLVDNN